METIAERLQSTLDEIHRQVVAAGRAENAVKLLAVSKTKTTADIVSAIDAGQRLFGENYVQEAIPKIESLQAVKDIQWHFIGPLQSNKTALVAEHFHWVQSIDRIKIARRLSDQRHPYKAPLNLCIQVNISEEPQKAGVLADEVAELAAQISQLPRVRLRGLMAIPAADLDDNARNQAFSRMHALFVALQSQYEQIDTLSMGMSGDWRAAISAGATMVRLGTAIFGPRE